MSGGSGEENRAFPRLGEVIFAIPGFFFLVFISFLWASVVGCWESLGLVELMPGSAAG